MDVKANIHAFLIGVRHKPNLAKILFQEFNLGFS
jgi:hypothetical protein